MVKMGIKRESSNQIIMPDSIGAPGGGVAGGMKLQPNKKGKGGTQVKSGCC